MKVAVRAEVIYLHGNASCRIAACELLRHSQPSATHAFGMHNEVKDLAIACWALLLKEQKGGGQSGPSRVVQPSTVTTCHWPGSVWERAKGQTQVLEAEPSNVFRSGQISDMVATCVFSSSISSPGSLRFSPSSRGARALGRVSIEPFEAT